MNAIRTLITLRRLNYIVRSSFAEPVVELKRKVVLFKGQPNFVISRRMSHSIDEETKNPSRNFNYDQLLEKKKDNNVVLIDVREHSEINETGKLPDSIHIPLGELPAALGELSDDDFKKKYNASKPGKDTEVIFSCKAGGRSLKALRFALELGYSHAGNYKGGWLDWAEKTKPSS